MTLKTYTQVRLIVQAPEASVFSAARAMEDNHVGCVIVCNGDHVVGLVTDRDLALRDIAFDLDPMLTRLKDVMSEEVVTISITASIHEAAALMAEHHVRRIPITDGPLLVGMVTLDDLVLDSNINAEELRTIVRKQLEEPSRHKEKGALRPSIPVHGSALVARARMNRRHEARARLAYESLLRRALPITGLDSEQQVATALECFVAKLARRLSPDEANHLLSQLPSLVRERIGEVFPGPDRSVTRDSIEQSLAMRLGIDAESAATLLQSLAVAVELSISAGEVDDIRAQLPEDLRELFPGTAQ